MTNRNPDRTSSSLQSKYPHDKSVRTDQPLLFAPSELLACGLRDAHTHPLVGKRTAAGGRSWRTSAARAWAWPLVEWSRTGSSYAAVGFDCDSREAIERAAASCMGGGDLPTPNVYATRTASGHSQVFVPHPVSWTHVCATRHGVARIPRALRLACDTPASRGASTGCSVRRTRRRPRARRRDFERPGRRRLAP